MALPDLLVLLLKNGVQLSDFIEKVLLLLGASHIDVPFENSQEFVELELVVLIQVRLLEDVLEGLPELQSQFLAVRVQELAELTPVEAIILICIEFLEKLSGVELLLLQYVLERQQKGLILFGHLNCVQRCSHFGCFFCRSEI